MRSGISTRMILDVHQSLYIGCVLAARERVQELLQGFVGAAKAAGASDEFIAALLMRRGWPSEEIYGALEEYWVGAAGVALPVRESAGQSDRDAFLYLLCFSTWATALGSLLFHLIDNSWIALLTTAVTMLGDFIWFVAYFLTGDLMVRFVLKFAAVFVIARAIFSYYPGALRWTGAGDLARERSRHVWYGFGALACVAITLAGAGTPSGQRRIEAAKRCVADLQQIARGVFLCGRS